MTTSAMSRDSDGEGIAGAGAVQLRECWCLLVFNSGRKDMSRFYDNLKCER